MNETIYTNRITIDIHTLDWTMGYYYGCEVLSPCGCTFTVEWGDGKVDRRTGKGDWVSLHHDYPYATYREEVPYRIHVWSEDTDGIIGFREGGTEVETCRLDTSQCPSLQYLRYHDLSSLDVSGNPALKVLDCGRSLMETLTLDNPELEVLDCSFSWNLKALNLSRCPSLRELDCRLCGQLTRLGLSNRSALRVVDYSDTALSGKEEEFLLRIVRGNGGEVVKHEEDWS